ncbi:obscurin-like protein 1 isoform X3 [Kryptolebias marmoratus]|uniref:obscurin-like protein 1 isoform X3 n=1 Tax=Kryptolebias marmoratus TaxID=37003 RepID=UPI0007F92330|nr:obscurin-like protein 1 isoform X3 [Kryptolebias marmoratus]
MDVFGGAPRFLAYPRPVGVQSGTDAVLKCQIGGDPRPAVIWERNNEKIDPQGRYRVFEDGNVYNLIISAVTIEDSGQYICKAKNSIGETYAAATLKVEGEAQEMELREENKPRFLIKPLSTRVGRGEDAVFSCKLWGNPRPEVVWEKDGRKLNEIFESTHFSVGHQDGGWFQLKIFKTRAPDGGVYTCKARNEFGEALAGAVLLVDAGPGHEEEGNRNGYTNGHWKIHQGKQRTGRQVPNRLKDDTMTKSTKVKMFAVTEGKHAKFRCFVTGKPKPEIIWRKDGRLILSGRRYLLYEDRDGYFTLKVLYCKQKDNGVYVCAASNTAGQTLSAVHLSVKEPPVRFKQPLYDLEVWERDLAVLECEVPEDSVPITWYLEDRRLQPGAKYGMEEWGTKRRLTIHDIGVDDDGIYLCEMPDGGRSIAEVAVKGTILRKLPRKVDVLEGENAAFCVEVEKEEMDIHWYKDGTELRETHQTIIKSFGRTHILVFVNTMPQDSGLVTFLVGRSKTSSQLRVKSARHCPPSCPVGVQINTERANAALLSWIPAPDSRKNPPSGYVLERQEVGTGSQEWLQCLTTDSATSVEILGDSVPCEADYRFRICSVNKYGKSNNVEFPRTVHLVPVARIQAPLQDALVPEGQDALFTIELSASVIGTWFLNGIQLQEDERYSIRRSRAHQSLRIRGVRDTDNGAEITFIAYGIRDSAALYIQAPLVKFLPLSEMDHNKFVEVGNPIVLYCEISDPATPVLWYKNGVQLQTMDGLHIQSEGTMRRIVIQSADFSHSGVYCCDAIDDVIRFNVEVEAPPVRFSAIPDAERNKTIPTGSPIVLQCELSDPSAQVHWYKDGSKLLPQSGVDVITDAFVRKLIVHSAEVAHSGLYCCRTKGDSITFSVDIKALPMKFSAVPEDMKIKLVEVGCPVVLQCVVLNPEAQVCWYKDEMQLMSNSELEIHSVGNSRTLVIQSAELCHSGLYRCATQDDTMEFQVEIKALPVTYSTIFDAERAESLEVGTPLRLECKVAESTVPVCWYKDDNKPCPPKGWGIKSNGTSARYITPSAELLQTEQYSCETSDDNTHFSENIEASTYSPSLEVVEMQSLEATCPSEPAGETSDTAFKVSQQRESESCSNRELDLEMGDIKETLVIEPTHPSNSGAYYCATADDVAKLFVKNQVPPPNLLDPDKKTNSPEAHCQIVQQFEISDPIAKACWYKDGTPIYLKMEAGKTEDSQILPLQSEFLSGDGRFSCNTSNEAELHENLKAGQCHYRDEIDEVADASVQFTVDVKATSPRCSPDQERNKSTEEAHSDQPVQKSLKCYSDIFTDKGGDSYKNHAGDMITPQSAISFTTNCTSKEQPKELYGSQETIKAQPQLCCHSVKSTTILSNVQHHTKQAMKSKGEEFTYSVQHKEVPSEEHHDSLGTVGQKDECCISLQTAPKSEEFTSKVLFFQSEQVQNSLKIPTVQLKPGNLQQISNIQSEQSSNTLQISPVQPNKFCKLDKPFESLHSAAVQSEGQCRSTQKPDELSERLLDCSQSDNVLSVSSHNSLRTVIDQSEDLNIPLHEPSVLSEKFCDFVSSASLDLSKTKEIETFQTEHLNLHTFVKWDNIYNAGQKGSNLSTLLHRSSQEETGQGECLHTTETAQDQEDSTVSCGQSSSINVVDFSYTKKTSTVQSDEIYLSSTSDSHWSGSVNANKVAVEATPSPSVTITTLLEAERNKSVEVGKPLMLQCEISDPNTQVSWLKDGLKLLEAAGQEMLEEGSRRILAVQSARLSHAGTYSCKTTDDAVQFHVDVKAPPQTFSAIYEADQNKAVMADSPVAPQCELSDQSGQVSCHTDGTELLPEKGADIQSQENLRSLVVPSAEQTHTDVCRCESKDDDIQFSVDVKAPPVKFSELQENERNKLIQEGNPLVLSCELSHESSTHVDWYKDDIKLLPQNNVEIQSDGLTRKLLIPSAESKHAGIYECSTSDDSITFKVDIKGQSPKIMAIPVAEKYKIIRIGLPIILQCQVSDPTAQVSWFKERVELFSKTGLDMKRDGSLRKLIIQSSKVSDSGLYSCSLADDVVTFHVDIEATPVRFSVLPEVARNKFVEAGCPIKLQCEVSEPAAQVCWCKDGEQLLPTSEYEIHTNEKLRALVIKSAEVGHSGLYNCESADDRIQFKVDVAAVPEAERSISVEADSLNKLLCEIPDPAIQTCWYEDGIKLLPELNTKVESKGNKGTLVMESATSSYSEVYDCKSDDDSDISDFCGEVKAPPVTFTDVSEKDLFHSAVEQEQLILSCEVSRADGVVQWYKDGAEIQSNNDITVQTKGTERNLTIHSVQLSDTGTYTCRAGDNILIFKVNIREPPVMIVHPKEDVHLDRHVPEEIILSCELSRPNGVVSWFKDGQKLQESENIKLKLEGPYRRLKILSSRVEDSGEYVCDTADDSRFFHLNITEPPVQILSPSQSQMELCQQTSERMVLSCEISRPNAVVRWYRDGLEVEENDNLILEVDGVYRRLIIPETTVKDSAEYVCDTGDDSVTFFVNIAEPPVRFIRPRKMASSVEKAVGETLVLDCEVSRPNAEITWKKNGEEVEDSRNTTILEDGIMRQLTIHSLTMEDGGQYICDAKDDVMHFNVNVQELPVKILGKTEAKTERQFLVSDDIILVCELSRANSSVSWYKDNHLIDDTKRYCCEEQDVFRSLVVLNAGIEDSGEYTCDAGDDKMVFHITVKEPPVQIIGNSGNPEHHVLAAGDDLILECEVSQPNASVKWLRNGEILNEGNRVKIDSHDVVRKLVLSELQPSDSGEYICDAIDDKLITIVKVEDTPAKFVNKIAKNNISAYENESVTLCATVSHERANVRWLKDGQLLNKDNIHISSEGKTHKLTINPLQLLDSGDYICDISTDEMFFSLTVKEMKVKFIRQLKNVVSQRGKSLTLQCEINKPKGDVQWLKDGKEITPGRRYTIRAQGRERSLTIHQLMDEDVGEYVCESTDDRTSATVSAETPRVVEFVAELRNITVREGEDAVFKCVVSPADVKLVWRLNGKQVALNERAVVSSHGLCHMLSINNCMVSDSGRVTADAEGLVSEAELQVQEQQLLFIKKMTPVVAEEYSEATLEVEVSLDAGEVQWMRQGVLIHPGAKYTPKHKGRKHSLTIHMLAMADRGVYSCETLHDRTQAQLTVEPRKITIKRGLTDIKTTERETASFEVELSHPNVPGTWIRNGIQLKPTNHFRMSAKGQVHSVTISNLSVEDTGSFVFCVENLKTSARLVVKEPPVTIFRKLENQKVPDSSVISLECELSRHNVDVKWLKNGDEQKPSKDLRIYAMGRKRFLQIMKCHVTDSGVYTCDAGDVTTSCTVEVYERKLSVLQGLDDLDIQEDQNAVFVCEISVEDVPGEWYKNGERIQPTSSIKIRQEGTKHFLLMCNVRAEDSGEIKFVARNVESVAYLDVEELPVNIVKPLQDKTALEKSRVILDCTVSNPRCSIRWYQGSNVILPSERFEICSEGCYRKLILQQVALEDEGMYSVQVGEYSCSAKLTVEAQSVLMVRELQDVEVVAPDDACFECEVSDLVLRSPVWSLNGDALQSGPQVCLEKMGTVHRLTLRQTDPDMSGVVEFTSGNANSRAQLRVVSQLTTGNT